MYCEITPLWTEVSRRLEAAAETGEARHLADASALLFDLADRERDAMQALTNICH